MNDHQHALFRAFLVLTGLTLGCMLVMSLGAHKAKAQQAAKVTLDPEISLGGAFSTSELSAGGTKFADTGQYGFLYGAGLGVGLQTNMFVFEPFARYAFMHDGGKLAILSPSSPTASNLIDAGARVGFRATKATNVYGILGYAWEDLSLPKITGGSSNHSPSGFEVGGGIEHSLFSSPLYARLEYTHAFFDSQSIAGTPLKVSPDLNVVRVGLSYKFGAGITAPNVFDTSKVAAEEKGCDPKLGNCNPLK